MVRITGVLCIGSAFYIEVVIVRRRLECRAEFGSDGQDDAAVVLVYEGFHGLGLHRSAGGKHHADHYEYTDCFLHMPPQIFSSPAGRAGAVQLLQVTTTPPSAISPFFYELAKGASDDVSTRG